jgi:subtilisin family serine protease
MRRAVLAALFVVAIVSVLTANAVPGVSKNRPLYSPEKLKIQLTQKAYNQTNIPEILYAEAQTFGIAELDAILQDLNCTKVIRAHRKVKDTIWEQQTGFDRWFVLRVPVGTDILNALSLLKSSTHIEQAIPEYYAYTQLVPNDTYYPNNWGHNNTAQLPAYQGGSHSGPGVGTIGFDSNAEAAWDDSQGFGSSSTIIAIIDTGVDLVHPDLRLVTGYDYGDNDSNPQDNSAQAGHGTCCSGVAAGIGNNALGVTGIGAGCSVMPLKIADTSGNLEFTYIENALTHAGDNNADVGSMSFGASMTYGSSPSTDTAVAYAYSHGVTLFAATANDNSSTIAYPANHPDVISVGAASPTGQRKSNTSSDGESWWGSNYGTNTQDANTSVDIMAPTILPATDISAGGGYSSTNYYMWFNGTSCATPYAAGVAGLLISKNPALTPAEVRTAMVSTAIDMTIDGGVGWDRYTGYGFVNAQGALATVNPGMPSCQITSPAGGSSFDLGAVITVNVNATDSNGTIIRVDFMLDGATTPISTDTTSPYSWVWDTTGFSGGIHTITARAVDNENNMTSNSVSINIVAPANEGFETGNFLAYPWIQSGNQAWTIQSADVFSGTYAAKSGTITHNQTSTMSIIITILTAGNITFYQKVSSEPNYDYLYFYIDGVQQGAWAGSIDWTSRSFPVTIGNHEFKWTYYKDGAVSTGSDCGWVDHITFPPHSIPTPPVITWNPTAINYNMATNQTATQTLTIGNTGSQDLTYTASVPIGAETVLDETFAAAIIPAGWSQQYISYTTSWTYAAGGTGNHPPAAYDGAFNARLFYAGTTPRVTRLITPALNLSNTTSATLSFWHTQDIWNNNRDELRVYYRTTVTGNWTNIATYTTTIATWTQEIINLPNLSSTYYIAFEGTAKYGYGVCLDKIVVTKQSGTATPWITLNGLSSINGILTGIGSNNITIGFNTNGLSEGIHNSTITIASNSSNNQSITIPVVLTAVNISTAPVINVSHASFDYGTVLINTTSANAFSIINSGTSPLLGTITTTEGYTIIPNEPVRNFQESDSNYRNTISYNVATHDTSHFMLMFTPTVMQPYNGRVYITHNASGTSKVIVLQGLGGKPILTLSTTTFNVMLAPGQSSIQELLISNPGNMPLSYNMSIQGNPGWLTINNGTTVSYTMAPGMSNKIAYLGFNAGTLAPGTYNATINGTSNDPVSPTFSINVNLQVMLPVAISPQTPDTGNKNAQSQRIISWNPADGSLSGYKVYFATRPDFSDAVLLGFVPAPQTSFAETSFDRHRTGFYGIVPVKP